MELLSLQQRFSLDGAVTFAEHAGLIKATVQTPHARATIYLQGAHITDWTPAGFEPVLFLSHASQFGLGLPIRGGVPLCFPWFAADTKTDRLKSGPGPHHGFARIELWELIEVLRCGEDVQLTLTLQPTQLSCSLGFDDFVLTLKINIGQQLHLELSVENRSNFAMHFEEVFHSYFAVQDVQQIGITGLENAAFIDNVDERTQKDPSGVALQLFGPTDRRYAGAPTDITIVDKVMGRRIRVSKHNANCTLLFNPWKELADLGSGEWQSMLAVETGNVRENVISLASKAQHVMSQTIAVEAM